MAKRKTNNDESKFTTLPVRLTDRAIFDAICKKEARGLSLQLGLIIRDAAKKYGIKVPT